MRLTVSHQIIVGLGAVLVVSVAGLAVTYDGMSRVHDSLRELAEVKEPSYSTTLEIELNVNAVVMATIAYLATPDSSYRRLVEADHDDLARLVQRYVDLTDGGHERSLAERLQPKLSELQLLTLGLMDRRDWQAAAWTQVRYNFEQADSLIDNHLMPGLSSRDTQRASKENLMRDLATELAELGMALGTHERANESDPWTLVGARAEAFRMALARYRLLSLSPREARQVAMLERVFEQMMDAMWPVLDSNEQLALSRDRLLALHAQLDDLLDDEIQALAQDRLYEPRRAAEGVAAAVLRRIQVLAPLLLGIGAVTAFILIHSIAGPVRALKVGAAKVGTGNLEHRIRLARRDEFEDVATEFNRMVEQLQATTVSKTELEKSEARLRGAVARLEEEIQERQRTEEERSRLADSLRRSETMSAMGGLVGGVAHEVRNPLFGMLSVLEAMESRFGPSADHARYLHVLREQADRLNRLMHELLEYGKPPAPDRIVAPLREVLAEAVAATRSAAATAGVQVVACPGDQDVPVELDRNRLARVFLNLLENAIQHTPRGGEVVVATEVVAGPDGPWLACRIADAGPGFREEDLAHVFRPFFTRRRGGTGLGLSIVQRIVEEHGGKVHVANGPRGGEVTVRLPVALMSVSAGAHADA